MPTRVFLDIAHGTEPLGRVIFELFTNEAPKASENFRALCTGEKSTDAAALYYKGCIFHRILADFMVQAGDFTHRNGQGGMSIYGSKFEDENLDQPIDTSGLLCMANKGPNTNGSQFFVTLRPCPHLNGKHTVFGRVVRGYEEVVVKMANVPVDEKARPLTPVTVTNSGELELRKVAKPATSPSPASEDAEPPRLRRKSKRSASEESERRHRKRAKKEKRRKAAASAELPEMRNETEEEYDARLEREEIERLAEQKKQELQRIKERYEREAETNTGGVKYRGRGRMLFVDPESRR
ncbi:Peptidyl-prolyl cis-trans isomerase [Mycena kentingensis (nom. inval.)]|nr:Peptidyl-prolyl cis-trans isomerase [Mycena kentingensis (nom. inval.)]